MKINRTIKYLSIGFIFGLLIGLLFAESMHFYDLGFSMIYFGAIFSILILGLLSTIDYFKKRNKYLLGNLAIFLGALIDLILIFINFKGYAFFVSKDDLSAIWFINLSSIIIIGIIGYIFDKVLKNCKKI